MKLSKRQLKRIIREERVKLLKEGTGQEQEDASYALEALLDAFIDQSDTLNPNYFENAVGELRDWFNYWIDNALDQRHDPNEY